MKAMVEVNCKLNPTQSAKKQALEFVKDLQKVIPIDRAKMRLKVRFDTSEQQVRLEEDLKASHQPDEFSIERLEEKFMELLIQPALFRELNNIVNKDKEFYQNVCIEIQDQQVTMQHEEGETELSAKELKE